MLSTILQFYNWPLKSCVGFVKLHLIYFLHNLLDASAWHINYIKTTVVCWTRAIIRDQQPLWKSKQMAANIHRSSDLNVQHFFWHSKLVDSQEKMQLMFQFVSTSFSFWIWFADCSRNRKLSSIFIQSWPEGAPGVFLGLFQITAGFWTLKPISGLDQIGWIAIEVEVHRPQRQKKFSISETPDKRSPVLLCKTIQIIIKFYLLITTLFNSTTPLFQFPEYLKTWQSKGLKLWRFEYTFTLGHSSLSFNLKLSKLFKTF